MENEENQESYLEDEEMLQIVSTHYVLGRLIEIKNVTPPTGKDYLSCVFRPISDEPNYILENEDGFLGGNDGEAYYRTIHKFLINDLPEYINGIDLDISTFDEIKEKLLDYFKDKMILFKPEFKYSDQYGIYYKQISYEDIDIKVMTIPSTTSSYFKIPLLTQKDYEDLLKGKEISLSNWNIDIFGLPNYLSYENKIILPTLIKVDTYDCKLEKLESYVEFEIDYDSLKKSKQLLSFDDASYIFLEKSTINTFKIIEKSIKTESDSTSENKNFADLDEMIVNYMDLSKEHTESLQSSKTLRQFYEYTKQKNLYYYLDDIFNFHACLKTRLLTILAGMPGTGKTRLPLEYAHFFNMDEKDNSLLFVPISPSLSEPSDLLGYYNPMSESYVPAESGLTSFLANAMKEKEKMHMVIFDEMNLSQIEYYFATFLSVLERDEDERNIRLYDDSLTCKNKDKFPSVINIGKNVLFVGTINIDETTKELSDRLLDRSFVISLRRPDFKTYNGELLTNTNPVKVKTISNDVDGLYSLLPMRDLSQFNYIKSLDASLRSFLDKFNKIDSTVFASFRTSKNIALYLDNKLIDENSSKSDTFSKDKAIDYVIRQTLVKKIKGPEEDLHEFLGDDDISYKDSKLYKLFEEYSSLSSFDSCKAELEEKAKEMKRYGYVR